MSRNFSLPKKNAMSAGLHWVYYLFAHICVYKFLYIWLYVFIICKHIVARHSLTLSLSLPLCIACSLVGIYFSSSFFLSAECVNRSAILANACFIYILALIGALYECIYKNILEATHIHRHHNDDGIQLEWWIQNWAKNDEETTVRQFWAGSVCRWARFGIYM